MYADLHALADITELLEEELNEAYIQERRMCGHLWVTGTEERMEDWYGRQRWPAKRAELEQQAELPARA